MGCLFTLNGYAKELTSIRVLADESVSPVSKYMTVDILLLNNETIKLIPEKLNKSVPVKEPIDIQNDTNIRLNVNINTGYATKSFAACGSFTNFLNTSDKEAVINIKTLQKPSTSTSRDWERLQGIELGWEDISSNIYKDTNRKKQLTSIFVIVHESVKNFVQATIPISPNETIVVTKENANQSIRLKTPIPVRYGDNMRLEVNAIGRNLVADGSFTSFLYPGNNGEAIIAIVMQENQPAQLGWVDYSWLMTNQ